MDILELNRKAWDKLVDKGNEWTKPVNSEEIKRAKNGDWQIILTPTKPVPSNWYPHIRGANILCLASGGGQQGPIFAAAGANVTVFDNSTRQLEQDEFVAQREGLIIKTVQGDMRDLSCFENEQFDLIVHPASNHCIDNVNNVWCEAYRILKKEGAMISGFCNPILSLIDWDLADKNSIFQIKYKLPYSDIEQLDKGELKKRIDNCETIEYGHSLEDLIGGQIKAGFAIVGFYEDNWGGREILDNHTNTFIATKASKI